ncbi:MAG: type II toxin-antitoxin system RelE/ParE family toxin [Flavobacteriales bacterium]
MTYTVVVLAAAQVEAAEAYQWYEVRRAGLGERFAQALETCLKGLALEPMHQLRKDRFRYVLVEKFPYRVVYVVEGDTVYVYQIRHTSRRPSQRYGP